MDSSWALDWGGQTFLIDPWLIGSEIDGFAWFNEQWHSTPPVDINTLGNYHSIIISQSYSDHCHKQTLDALDGVPFLSSPSAAKRLRKELPGRNIDVLPELTSQQWHQVGSLQLAYLDPGRKINPIYNGIVIRNGDEVVVYFPHGFTLTDQQLRLLQQYQTILLITSFSRFKLPSILGGAVNPGADNAYKLISELNPGKVVHTHDENKHAKGLVKFLAKVDYPNMAELEKSLGNRFVYLQYETMNL